ncbi:FimV/HubP family polar landmark protein, partial [Psychromonas arctica]
MNRILLGLVCCSPLFFSVPVQSVELIGPNDEIQSPQQQTVEATPASTAASVTQINTPTKYGPIKSSETLWSIATKLRPNNNVSVYQTLAAIYKSNPSAFRQGDINKIIEASVINIPSPALIAQQSNTEAYALLKPTPKVSQITNPAPKPRVITAVQPVPVDVPKKVETSFVPIDEPNNDLLKKDLEDKQLTLIRNELQVADQEKELELLNEQLIVATEANQRLKLKLQPLSDEITSLSEQVAEDVKVQKELQALIDQYKAQIDAIEEPPFSGPGILNTILRVISSSTSMLIFAILFPLLLLTGIFLLILRLKSKRELALRQQELAESTAILSEEKSEFDTLLDDDLDIQPLSEEQEDSDFIVDVSRDEPETTLMDDSNAEDNGDEKSNVEENTAEQINEVEEVIDSELIDQGTSDNQPEEVNSNDLDFDLDAMIDGSDDVIDLSEADLNLEGTDQKDLDLAAQWESELAQAELEENNGVEQETTTEPSIDEVEELDPTFSESEQEPIELDIPEDNDEVATDLENDVEEVIETVDEVTTDLEIDVDAVIETVAPDIDADVEEITETVEEVQPDIETDVEEITETVEEVTSDIEPDVEEITETVEEVQPDIETD